MRSAKSVYLKRAVRLSWFTIIYNIAEGLVSVYFGLEQDSIALAGFGADSFIEVASAIVVLWRFKSESNLSTPMALSSERRATRAIGWLFVALSAGVVAASALKLRQHIGPDTTIPGIIISLASLSFMFYLWTAKKNVARQLDSSTVEKDAACSLACIKLSLVLLAGSLLYGLVPSFWWVDSAAALALAFLIGGEGFETIRSSRREDFTGGCGCSHCE
ncbi:MAG TPA: heavy metal transporter [Elusimicrobia bacterium]|nr:heavy metal transporter [Elusimicrobiota bacterium]HBT61233.1 heavy metal transporter [Elusimicrobiota bacterium]